MSYFFTLIELFFSLSLTTMIYVITGIAKLVLRTTYLQRCKTPCYMIVDDVCGQRFVILSRC